MPSDRCARAAFVTSIFFGHQDAQHTGQVQAVAPRHNSAPASKRTLLVFDKGLVRAFLVLSYRGHWQRRSGSNDVGTAAANAADFASTMPTCGSWTIVSLER